MVKTLADIDAESRSGLVCPKCFKEGLIAVPELEEQFDDQDKAIIHASGCSNRECEYHPKAPGANAIPASEIKKQYSGASSSAVSLSNVSLPGSRTLGVVMTLGLAFLLIIGMPFLGGTTGTGGGTASAQDVSVNDSSPMVDSVETNGNWTVYQTEGGYIVATEISGEVVYLTPDGDIARTPHLFQSQQGAIEAIQTWRDSIEAGGPGPILGPNSTTGPETGTPIINNTGDISPDPLNLTALEIYEYDGDFVVSGSVNGSVVYLTPAGNLSTSPYFFDNRTVASNYYLEYISQNGLNETTDGIEIDPVPEDELEEDLQGIDRQAGETPSDVTELPGDFNDSNFTVPDYVSDDGYTIEGEVVTDGESHPDGTVHLRSTPRSTQVTDDGRFAFTNVSPGHHKIWVVPDNSSMPATAPVTVNMTNEGELRVVGDPSGALYVEDSNGSVAGNSITLFAQPPRNISYTGEGSELTANVLFENDANARSLNVTLEPVSEAQEKSKELTPLSEGSREFSLGGTAPPKDSSLSLTGLPASEWVTETGTITENKTFHPHGNLLPRQTSLVLTGTRNIESFSQTGSVSNSGIEIPVDGNILTELDLNLSGTTVKNTWRDTLAGSPSYTLHIPGNLDPVNSSVTLVGQETVDSRSRTGSTNGGTMSLGVPGNKLRNLTVELYGNTSIQDWSSNPYSNGATVDVPGNVSPKNPSILLTGKKTEGNKQTEQFSLTTQDTSGGEYVDRSLSGTISEGGSQSVDVSPNSAIKGPEGSSNPEIAVTGVEATEVTNTNAGARKGWNWATAFKAPVDGTYNIHYDWSISVEDWGYNTGPYGEVEMRAAGNKFVDRRISVGEHQKKSDSGGGVYTVQLSEGETVDIRKDSYSYYATVSVSSEVGKVVREVEPSSSTLVVNGQSHSLGKLEPGEQSVVEAPEIESGSNTLELHSPGQATVDYELLWSESKGLQKQTVVSNEGNVGTDVTATLSGKKLTENVNDWSTLEPGESRTVSVGGKSSPVGQDGQRHPELVVTGRTPEKTQTISTSASESWTTVFTAPKDGEYTIDGNWKLHLDDYGHAASGVEAYLRAGGERLVSEEMVCEHCTKTRRGWVYETVSLNEGESIDVKAVESPYYAYDATAVMNIDDVSWEVSPDPATINVNGQSHDLGALQDGEQVSFSASELKRGDNKISLDSYGNAEVSYDLKWKERTITENLSLSVDGENICTFNGKVTGTHSCTVPSSIFSNGDHTFTVSADDYGADVSLEYTPEILTKNVTINGDNGIKSTHQGPIQPDETIELSLPKLSNGEQYIDVTAAGPTPNWRLEAQTRTLAKTPSVQLEGKNVLPEDYPTYLGEGQSYNWSALSVLGEPSINSSEDTEELSISNGNDIQLGYSLNWDSVQETHDPSVSIGSETPVDEEVDGYLPSGETVTVPLSGLKHGNQQVSVDSVGPRPQLQFNTTTREAAENLSVSLDDKPAKSEELPRILSEDGNTSVSLQTFITKETLRSPTDTHIISLSTGNDIPVDYNLTWKSGNVTQSPEIKTNEDLYCSGNSTLSGKLKCDIPRDAFEGGSGVELATASGPVKYNLTYMKRVGPENVEITLNGEEYIYPTDFSGGSAPLGSGTVSTQLHSLKHGENNMTVGIEPVAGLQPEVEPLMSYERMVKTTGVPVITVTSSTGVTHKMNLSSLDGLDGTLSEERKVSLPIEWFDQGENAIRITTANGTPIVAQINGTSLRRQTGLLN